MAASNYSVNIKLNTKPARVQLEALERRVNKLRASLNNPLRIESKATLIKKQQVALEDKKFSMMHRTRRLGDQIRKFEEQGIKLDKLRLELKSAARHTDKERFQTAKDAQKFVAEELKTLEKQLEANIKNAGVDRDRVRTLAQLVGLKRTEAALNRTAGITAARVEGNRVGPFNRLGLPSTEMLKPDKRGIKILDLGTQGRQQTSVPFGPQIATASQLKAFGRGPEAMDINTRINQQMKRLRFNHQLNMLEAKRVNTIKLRVKMGQLVDAQNRRDFGSIQSLNNELTAGITKEQNRLKLLREQNKERRRGASFKFPMGASSPLNFSPDGQLLPGPAPKGGFGFQSALISGAFPLLFGQGPLVGAAGFLGGGLGEQFGGQMGGFAGGLVATAAATAVQQFATETSKLGQALNDTTKDIEAVSAALGITGTEFEKNLKTLEKLGGEEEAFAAARERMINIVGQEGVTALQQFGKGTTELANQFTIAMTQMKAGFASFLKTSGLGAGLLRTVSNANLMRQAEVSDDVETQKLLKARDILMKGSFFRSKEEKALLAEFPGITSANQARDAIFERQKTVNKNQEEAAVQKLLADIQKQRVKNISNEIALLEKSFGMSTDELEIEKQIMQMKQDGEIKDEAEIRNKLKHLQNLQKERQLAEETAAAFERMSQSIATDISQGIQGMIRGTSTLNDMLNNVLNKLMEAAFNMAFFGNMQGTLGGGGLLGSVLGPIFGGLGGLFGVSKGPFGGAPLGPLGNPLSQHTSKYVPGMVRANGGPVKGGSSYIVGERGPELFSPGVSGMITPNHALGGSVNVVVNVDASGSSVEGDEQQSNELGLLISAAVQSEILQQQRPGGLLA